MVGLLINSIGAGVVGAQVSPRIETEGSEVVCLIDVKRSATPVYAKTTKGDRCFYVRSGNTTRMLEGPDIVDYVKQHWDD